MTVPRNRVPVYLCDCSSRKSLPLTPTLTPSTVALQVQNLSASTLESERDDLRNSVPIVPSIVVASDTGEDLCRKQRELDELNERLRTRIGQIERAEQRLLALQEQILSLPTLEARIAPTHDTELSSSDVFRVDVSSEEPLRLAPSTSSSPRGSYLSLSSNAISPTPMRSLMGTDTLTPSGGFGPAHSTARSSNSLGPPSSSLSPSPAPGGRQGGGVFNIRSSTNSAQDGDRERFNFFSSSSSSSSAPSNNSISFTVIKSWFGSSSAEEKAKVHFNVDASQIQLCEKIVTLSTADYEVHRVSVGGWGCNVKVMPLGTKEASDARFFKRIKLLETLPSHTNIARYYFHDMSEDGRTCRIFTEWFQTSLADVLQKRAEMNRPFTASEIEFVLLEVVKGSEFLHSYSILHRNLSPNNIHVLLNEQGEIARVAIANLDTAKVITDRVNAKGTTLGDPRYCAPEVVTAKKTGAYSFPSDIWSLGLVAYSLLTLRRPWHEENNPDSIAEHIVKGERPRLDDSVFMEHYGSEYAPIVEIFNECTRIKSDDRPTVSILKQALITKASISEHRRATQLNIGFTYQPRREASTFFENFLVIGCPIGLRKPEAGIPSILYQYPPSNSMPLSHPEILLNFSMAQPRASTRIKRTNSMSNVNQKLFASRDMTEHSSSACIFTMMEGEELRYGVCVYFEEPVDIVPSFMSTQRVIEEAKKDPVAVDVKRISKYTTSLATPATKRKPIALPPHIANRPAVAAPITPEQPATLVPAVKFSEENTSAADPPLTSSGKLLGDPTRRRRHQRTASDGSALKLVTEAAAEAAAAAVASGGPVAASPAALGHVKFTYRCYMLFSKWPFFKLHFEVLWAILAQERLARISAPEPRPKATPAPVPTIETPTLSVSDSSSKETSTPATTATITTTTTPSIEVPKNSAPPSEGSPASSPIESPLLSSPTPSGISSLRSKARSVSLAPSAHAQLHGAMLAAEKAEKAEKANAAPSADAALASATEDSTGDLSASEAVAGSPTSATSLNLSAVPPSAARDPTAPRSPTPKRAKRSTAVFPGTNAPSEVKESTTASTSALSRALDEPEPTEENCLILRMLGTYHRIPVPTEKHQTTVTLANLSPILYTPGDVTEAVAEWCFPCMFRTLSVKTLVKLFTAVLLEEKIVMFCADTGILSSCVTGLTALLRPYAWQGTFLPIVPPSMMAVMESPIPFVAGIPESSPQLSGVDGGVLVDLQHDVMTGRLHFPRLPHSDRIYDAFSAYATAIASTGPPSNPCKSSVADGDSLAKLLAALALWHTHLLEQLAAVPAVGLDFKWGNNKEVEQVVRALSFSERDFYREFFETQHFSIISDRLNTIICQIRARKDHQKHVQKLENIFTQ